MNVAATILQILVTYGPKAYEAAVELLNHPNPQKADFLALKESISQETYEDFIAQRRAERGLPAISPLPVV